MVIVHAWPECQYKKMCFLLSHNENELIEKRWEVNVQIKITVILTVMLQESTRDKNAN